MKHSLISYLYKWVLLAMVMGFAGSCKPNSTIEDGKVKIKAGEGSQVAGRKNAFSEKDILKTEIINITPLQAWQVMKFEMVGVFPDQSKARIIDNVKWKTIDSDFALIDSDSGELLASAVGKVKISAKFKAFEATKIFKINLPALEIVAPKTLSINELLPQSADLSWKRVSRASQYRLFYKVKDGLPLSCTDENVDHIDYPATSSHGLVQDLLPATSYHARICVIETLLTANSASQSRMEEGALLEFTTPAAAEESMLSP